MKYVALLRGINVGGKTKVPMADLKKVLEENNFKNVKTILNSGNVIFELAEENKQKVCERVEEILEQKFGWHIFVILRTHQEITNLVKKAPFKNTEITKDIRRYVSFLKNSVENKTELCYVIDLSNQPTVEAMAEAEKKYGKTNTTTRNWNTVEKIAAL